MLEPNSIPSNEPLIRVGIILPEDRFRKIKIEIPEKFDYKIISEGINKSIDTKELLFKKKDNSIQLNNLKSSSPWKIVPNNKTSISPKSGLKVKNVVAGRGFHWQKLIDVFLSGSVEISVIKDQLILINELPIEEYLMCVATSEMSAACPDSLIEAQTIAARSWMLANVEQKHVSMGMDVCNDDCCQRYQGTTYLSKQSITGAMQTYGQVLLFENNICDARYSKSCGGAMEIFSTIWQGSELPYLQNKFDYSVKNNSHKLPLNTNEIIKEWVNTKPDSFCCPETIPEESLPKYLGSVDKEGTYYRWQFQYKQNEITELLNKKLNLDATAIINLEPISRGESGRIINLEITYLNSNNETLTITVERDFEIRRVLHKKFMYSSCIDIEISNIKDNIPHNFIIKGAGWGHGVGLCQIGALGMSLKGYKTEEILYHYFPGSKLEKIY